MERYRIVSDAAVYFVTFSIVDWLPIFVSEEPCRIVADSFRFCHEQKALRFNAFVIMPTHLHANPCRKGLVIRPEYWRYSSAGYLLHDGKMQCDVPLTPIVW
jgi:hypothetical protein